MTAKELIRYFNTEFTKNGIETKWPETFEVDAETYANCCQYMFEYKSKVDVVCPALDIYAMITLGPNCGLMFKNVELIYKPKYE